jgi:hypothetical protein
MRTVGLVIAALFSLLYVSLYPLLTGGSTIYWYPYWSSGAATAYIAGGILLQGGFCLYGRNHVTVARLGAQIGAGVGYLALTLLKGGLYQS